MLRCSSEYLVALAFAVVTIPIVLCQEQPPPQPDVRAQFHVIREWDYLNFTWPSDADYKTAMENGRYVPENIIMSGIQAYDDRFYIALPRMKSGVPATLVSVPAPLGPIADASPALAPYPSWEMNAQGDCNALQNVQNVAVDRDGNLWVVDGGRTGTLTKEPSTKCQPKLVVIDTRTNRTTSSYTFPDTIAMHNGSFLYDLVVDQTPEDTFAYITDNSGTDPGIIVYTLKMNKSWKIRDDGSMRAFLDAHDFKVNDVQITVPINLAGIALGPNYINAKYRKVYYSPISSFNLYSISTEILRNESYSTMQVHQSVTLVGRRPSQTDGMVMDSVGNLYYGLLSMSSIAVWNSSQEFNNDTQRIIARDSEYIQWPNAFTFDRNKNIILLTNKLQKFIYGSLNLYEPNFRLLTAYTGTESYVFGTPLPPINNPDRSQTQFNVPMNDTMTRYNVGGSQTLPNTSTRSNSNGICAALFTTIVTTIFAVSLQ